MVAPVSGIIWNFRSHPKLNGMSAMSEIADRRGFVGWVGILEENGEKNKKSRTGEVRLFSSSEMVLT